jgi:hypothetical protein
MLYSCFYLHVHVRAAQIKQRYLRCFNMNLPLIVRPKAASNDR